MNRIALFSLAALLMMGPLAGAQPAETARISATIFAAETLGSPGSANANLAAIVSAQAPPGCANAKPPSLEPASSQAAFVCGACSDTLCVGQQRGTFCKFEVGHTYTCQPVVAACSAKDCQCWTGPIP